MKSKHGKRKRKNVKVVLKIWENSIVFENHLQRCAQCGDLIQRNKWYKIRKDNGIIFAFCSRDHEREFDKNYKKIGRH